MAGSRRRASSTDWTTASPASLSETARQADALLAWSRCNHARLAWLCRSPPGRGSGYGRGARRRRTGDAGVDRTHRAAGEAHGRRFVLRAARSARAAGPWRRPIGRRPTSSWPHATAPTLLDKSPLQARSASSCSRRPTRPWPTPSCSATTARPPSGRQRPGRPCASYSTTRRATKLPPFCAGVPGRSSWRRSRWWPCAALIAAIATRGVLLRMLGFELVTGDGRRAAGGVCWPAPPSPGRRSCRGAGGVRVPPLRARRRRPLTITSGLALLVHARRRHRRHRAAVARPPGSPRRHMDRAAVTLTPSRTNHVPGSAPSRARVILALSGRPARRRDTLRGST